MLVNAFQQNCDELVLLAGDEDYVELVEEVKRYGQKVNGIFFRAGLSENLRLALDAFEFIDQLGFGNSFEGMKKTLAEQIGSSRDAP